MKTAFALCFCSSLLCSVAFAQGKTKAPQYRIAIASVKIDGKLNSVKVKLDAKGRIVPWTEKKWAGRVTPRQGVFSYLADARGETSVFEWEHAGKAKNGYGLVTLGTTADSITFGVNLQAGKGFFKYQDLGSGNGNSQYVLTVKEGKSSKK